MGKTLSRNYWHIGPASGAIIGGGDLSGEGLMPIRPARSGGLRRKSGIEVGFNSCDD